jgi:hypothetical protein
MWSMRRTIVRGWHWIAASAAPPRNDVRAGVVPHCALRIRHSAFGIRIRHSAFGIRHSAFGIRHSALRTAYGAFLIPRSSLPASLSANLTAEPNPRAAGMHSCNIASNTTLATIPPRPAFSRNDRRPPTADRRTPNQKFPTKHSPPPGRACGQTTWPANRLDSR